MSRFSKVPCDSATNLLMARPWCSVTVNEGSSLKAYTTYEYFLRQTPSLMSALLTTKSVDADILFRNLSSFSFVAIFPFYNHVDQILKCVRKMRRLKTLFVKLCPEPESNVLSDEIEDARGHIEVNDPWNEFETSYTLITHTVIYLTLEGDLEQFHADDVCMQGIRDHLEQSVTKRLQQWWLYDGHGCWNKVPSIVAPEAQQAINSPFVQGTAGLVA